MKYISRRITNRPGAFVYLSRRYAWTDIDTVMSMFTNHEIKTQKQRSVNPIRLYKTEIAETTNEDSIVLTLGKQVL
jgi:hypothetical protein